MKPANRLQSELFTVSSEIIGAGREVVGAHIFEMQAGYESGQVVEIAFAGRGKVGQGIDLLFQDVGLWISRALQGRDPSNGAELGDDRIGQLVTVKSPMVDQHGNIIGELHFEMAIRYEQGRATRIALASIGAGAGIEKLIYDVGQWVMRVLQDRDPMTGLELHQLAAE